MIFVDTSFWVALQNVRDASHQQARQLMRSNERTSLLTTNLVRGETWTVMRRRVGHRYAVQFLDLLESTSRVEVLGVSDSVEAEALLWLRRHDERTYSFVDATSFVVMKSRRVHDAFAFDEDFSVAGFRELRA